MTDTIQQLILTLGALLDTASRLADDPAGEAACRRDRRMRKKRTP